MTKYILDFSMIKVSREIVNKIKELIELDNIEFVTQKQTVEKAILRLYEAYKRGLIAPKISHKPEKQQNFSDNSSTNSEFTTAYDLLKKQEGEKAISKN